MGEALKAYEQAAEVITIAAELRDYGTAALVYESMINIYEMLDVEEDPRAYFEVATQVLTNVYEAQLAQGDLGSASEALFMIGTLFFKLEDAERGFAVFQKSVVQAVRATRFDIAAMGHLMLGLIAQRQGDKATFTDEIERAQMMGELSGDPGVMETIKNVLEGGQQPGPSDDEDIDTQLL
jgi:hypothetical protein